MTKEVTYDKLKEWDRDSYVLIDIRDDELVDKGIIPGAIRIFSEDLENSTELAEISLDKKLVFYCQIGRKSKEIDDTLELLVGRVL